MANSYFDFKKFRINQDRSAMKVTTDACLFGAWVADKIKNEPATKLLDAGTGTGLLSLMIAQVNPEISIDAVEINENAAAQAKENIELSPWSGNIRVIQGDLKKDIITEQYDFVISNPPFYENELKAADPAKNLAHHEGLTLAELIKLTKKLLKKDGRFFYLLPFKRNKAIQKLLLDEKCAITDLVFVRQTTKHDYFRIMLSGSFTNTDPETSISELAITGEDKNYTTAFTELLQPYYLTL